MFFVTVLHVLGHGGVLGNTSGISNSVAWLVETIAFCSVNCYAIISGFVMYSEKEKPYRYSKYITMWLQVFFYSFGISMVAFASGSDTVGIREILKSAFPFITKQYWYFSCYTGVFFVAPYINKLIRSLNKKEVTIFILIIFTVFACPNRLMDSMVLNAGYSFIWLALMYVFGAWLKKCYIASKIKSKYALLALIVCVLISWLFKILLPIYNTLFISYLSPTMIIIAVCLVIIFSKLNINNAIKKFIKCFSPAAFGVYLIHEQYVIRANFVVNKFLWIAKLDWYIIPFAVLGCALGVFVVCIIIEKVRMYLFKVLKINKIAENLWNKAESFLKNNLSKFISKIAE